jgi:phosphoglycerate kinase
MSIPSIAEIDISEKRVFIRADLDIPLGDDGSPLNVAKILSVIPTIKYALSQNARVIIASSLGKPRGKYKKKYSLEPIGRTLSEMLDAEIFFPDNSIGEAVRKIGADMGQGQVMLLENLDFQKGELENSAEFAKNLAECAEIYVNEAFPMADQLRASLVGICENFEKICLGLQFKKELQSLDRIRNPERPFTAILGGSNVIEKIEIMESMLEHVDTVIVGGVLANTFLKVLGGETGKSKIDSRAVYSIKKFISSAEIRNIKVILPEDIVAIKGNLNNYSASFIISGGRVPQDLTVVDIGPAAQSDFAQRLSKAKTILWAGPMGVCEHIEFRKGTESLARALAKSEAFTVIIGQDTIDTALESIDKESRSFISMGGRTALRYIMGYKLRVLDAMEERLK